MEVVVLNQVLIDEVNVGYQRLRNVVVVSVNDVGVCFAAKSFAELLMKVPFADPQSSRIFADLLRWSTN